jgi:uncharacterized protein YndB with AHSA1/START domain
MTSQRTFKRRVRERMAKTGESYTSARRMLIASGDRPETEAPAFAPPTSEEAVVEATGRGWAEWVAMLDAWGAAGRSHGQVAAWLREEHGLPGWWAQAVTVGWERARGRAPGQRADGFEVSASRTVAVPVQRLWAAWEDPEVREHWLPGAEMRTRTATAPLRARYDWEEGATRVAVWFEAVGEGRSRVSMAHQRLPDADAAEGMRDWWRGRLDELKRMLESG